MNSQTMKSKRKSKAICKKIIKQKGAAKENQYSNQAKLIKLQSRSSERTSDSCKEKITLPMSTAKKSSKKIPHCKTWRRKYGTTKPSFQQPYKWIWKPPATIIPGNSNGVRKQRRHG